MQTIQIDRAVMLAAPAQTGFCGCETTDCPRGIFKMRRSPLFAKLRVVGIDRVVIPAIAVRSARAAGRW
jgi:hypothetical protein